MPGKEFDLLKPLSERNPYLNFLGIELLDASEGWVKMKLSFRPEFLQPFTVHGGAIYSLADAAAAHALMTRIMPEQYPTTVEQRINFLKAVKDQDVYCEATILNLGRTLAYAEVTMTTADGTLVAKSAATLMRLDVARAKKE
ncbi:MAG: PaaI family thioesterase [Acidobacteriota bacterium]|nr:PaaI family thioesterase [Acidobacteriota bacterium]